MVNQTSLEAYIYLVKSNKMNANETIVHDVIKKFPEGKTIREISQILGWTDNRVSGRTKSLKLKGWIVPVARKTNLTTGCSAEVLTSVNNYSKALEIWYPEAYSSLPIDSAYPYEPTGSLSFGSEQLFKESEDGGD